MLDCLLKQMLFFFLKNKQHYIRDNKYQRNINER